MVTGARFPWSGAWSQRLLPDSKSFQASLPTSSLQRLVTLMTMNLQLRSKKKDRAAKLHTWLLKTKTSLEEAADGLTSSLLFTGAFLAPDGAEARSRYIPACSEKPHSPRAHHNYAPAKKPPFVEREGYAGVFRPRTELRVGPSSLNCHGKS